jgi:ribonucleoside-triphosphate reductase
MIGPDDDSTIAPREGAYDPQLSFSIPFVEAPSAITRIIKRDGREEPFEQRKIADAIFNAASAIGGDDRDRAESLASGVTIYLAKRLNGAPPTVDQIHDAVEKVLIEMGHARTALAYVRYRDKRERLRKLRSGDVTAILKELDEARQQRDALEPTVQRPLFVRTSDEQLAGWDRERIAQALVRETRMPENDAQRVAAEVELQVNRASLTTLTAALVRELVDAKLVELGLEKFRARHMRLGVPLYDAEQIICTPNQGEVEGQQDPAATDFALAQRVKREFALSAVHSTEVTEAHLRGDIHLHGLSQIDRAHSATHSLEFIKRFGLAIFSGSRFAPPPTTANGLVAQSSLFNATMQRHFIDGVRWCSFNETMTPILHSGANMDRIARLSLFGLIAPVGTPPATIEFCWPQSNVAACMFAMHFAEVWGAAIDEGSAFGMPHIDVQVDSAALRHADFRALLETLLESYERRSRVTLRFDRGTTDPPAREWPARDMIGGIVTLNLPRAAYHAQDTRELCNELAQRARVAFDALAEKQRFLDRLFTFGGVGPLAALAFRHRGRAYADPAGARYVLGVTGLNECVQLVTKNELHAAPAATECAQHLLLRLRQEADAFSANEGVDIMVGADTSEVCARRFARLDLQAHTEAARAVTKYDSITRDATYTPGVNTIVPLGPIEKARAESDLHFVMGTTTPTPVCIESSNETASTLIELIEQALVQTECTALRFVCGRAQMDFGQM